MGYIKKCVDLVLPNRFVCCTLNEHNCRILIYKMNEDSVDPDQWAATEAS